MSPAISTTPAAPLSEGPAHPPGADGEGGPEVRSIATLRPGDELDGVYACTRKERQIARTGNPYLTVELRDGTGAILARAFHDADLLAGRFERGELVRARGRVERFRDQLQLELHAISRAEGADADPTRFLPTAYRDRDELEGFLEHLAREVYDPALARLLRDLLADAALREQLRLAPCAVPGPASAAGGPAQGRRPFSAHHAYLGGLLEHTVAVTTMAIELCAVHTGLDRDLLIASAIVHDLGRTREFDYGAEIRRTREGRLLGHVQLGLRVIAEHAPAALAGERRLALEHCVMLHHGPDQSLGQRFDSPEALALCRLNALDAGVKGALEHGSAALAR